MKQGDIYSPCMEALSPQRVMEKIEEILDFIKFIAQKFD